MLVKYPHCTPITPSRRGKLWKDAAPVSDLTMPTPENGTEKNEKTKELDLQTPRLQFRDHNSKGVVKTLLQEVPQ